MESVSAKNPVRIGRRFRSQSEKTPEMAKGLSKGEWDAIGTKRNSNSSESKFQALQLPCTSWSSPSFSSQRQLGGALSITGTTVQNKLKIVRCYSVD